MKQTSEENRKIDRRQLVYYLKVYDTASGDFVGYLGDISFDGLMLFRPDSVEPDRLFNLTLRLTAEMDLHRDLQFEARSIWCDRDANPDYHAVGFKFSGLSQDDQDTVSHLVEKFGFI